MAGVRTISSTAFIDPLATVTGNHPITVEEGALILPRAQIDVSQGSVDVGAGVMVGEKAVVGCIRSPEAATSETQNRETRIGANARIESFAKIAVGVSVGEASVIDSHATLDEDVQVGSHSKVSHGVTLPKGTIVGDWEIVTEITSAVDGELGRRIATRKRDNGEAGQRAETFRLRALRGEREGLLEAMQRNKAAEDQRKRQSARPPVRKG